ncbi:hypothetical protein O3P69_013313 [Scylla paramamosain]|uniref:Uncharacterized protein n=1 Tax=Scylla paramamosain TaxID=85552 RepID=A0AAW0U355_SCYPA
MMSPTPQEDDSVNERCSPTKDLMVLCDRILQLYGTCNEKESDLKMTLPGLMVIGETGLQRSQIFSFQD